MKNLTGLFCFFILLGLTNAQQANDYFPSQTGFEWKFKIVPYDSLGNPVYAWAEYRIDSFNSVENYQGKSAKVVLSKTGSFQDIFSQPFSDTLFFYTEGSEGYEYFNINNIEGFLKELDSLQLDPGFNFTEFFISLQNWYPVYKFANPVNNEYILFSVDRTIATYPLRFQLTGTRLQDETIQSVLGSLSCKKFVTKLKVFAVLGFFTLELFSIPDTLWIAPGNWIVQDIVPSQTIDLTLLSIAPFTIYGYERKLTDELVNVADEIPVPLSAFLYQNYPNPFNPSTKISWQSPVSGHQTLKIYDVLGNEVATLVDEYREAGRYEVEFQSAVLSPQSSVHSRQSAVGSRQLTSRPGSALTSGIYLYRLEAGSYAETKKMILIK